MLFVNSVSLDPYFNLACEEYLMNNFTEDIFRLWQNDNTIVVGRNQNTLSEINSDFVKESGIRVVRRMTGGGAVYHDKGNINFTFIKNGDSLFSDYKTFTQPIVDFLKTLGVEAVLSGRNDILIDGKKVSGNAQFMKDGRVLHHGTLLLASSSDIISKALKVSEDKISSKGIKSVKSRVTNINSYLKEPMTAEAFKKQLADFVIKNSPFCQEYDIDAHFSEIEKLKCEKYATWEWNYGYSPKYDFCKKHRFPSGSVEVNLHIGTDGVIEKAKIYGDFFSQKPIDELCDYLIGIKHKEEFISSALNKINVVYYISGVTNKEFTDLLF